MTIKLVVGLGNPGAQYDATRHNAGFDYVDQLARRHSGNWQAQGKYFGDVCDIRIAGERVWLLKPMTYMNRSGQAVGALANFYKIEPEEILVAHDELDIPPGAVKLKKGGGHGGHNGLKDIIKALANNKDFYRLRLGIGHPGNARDVADFVLRKAPISEQQLTQQAIDAALDQDALMLENFDKAMSLVNGFKAT
ncbi:aminoacyl-tRNA hydrolase [Salinibius halmophilus]|uniref:aminoacyl-tRNA hydrolase n=1 Tax=Salinibius halmophilus TaxID=1853216 RepID=UPI000E667489|nr:aminoacyl-tRNA hydrolase [Salinibius halmophilus]